jgi:hypothetical protein
MYVSVCGGCGAVGFLSLLLSLPSSSSRLRKA